MPPAYVLHCFQNKLCKILMLKLIFALVLDLQFYKTVQFSPLIIFYSI